MKRNYLRCACVVLCLALLLCSCGGVAARMGLDPKKPITITVWHYYNGVLKNAFDDMVSEFNSTVGQQQGIFVTGFSQGDIFQLTDKLVAAVQKKVGSEEVPAIFSAYADTAYQVDQYDCIADLDNYLSKEEQGEFVPAYLEEGRFDAEGSLKIFPIAKSTEITMLNETAWRKFAEATGAELSELSTVEGLTRTAKAYYEWTDSATPASDDGKAFFGRDAMANYFLIGCKQLDRELWSVKDGSAELHADKNALRRLWDNYYIPYLNGWFGGSGRFRSDNVKFGDLISFVGSSSSVGFFPDEVTVNDSESHPITALALAPPCFEGGRRVAVQQGAGMVVTKGEPRQEYAACVFLKWFTECDRNIEFALRSGYLPVKKEANDAARIQAVADSGKNLELSQKMRDALPVILETVNSYELYTSTAFRGGSQARGVLESSLFKYVKADAAGVEALIQRGVSRKDALAHYETDENFEKWYGVFVSALNNVIR